ncbi:ATP-grasp domain-containing protein [Haladaptatus caseinilyticus]|uniref:hypothetical protein n=1 Tax=Haladaptatus caseinilyticus TaxID=2993314 RepID=UPI00224B79A5|nr:hypothetical protein [Haladaptatus caseinilyticus]
MASPTDRPRIGVSYWHTGGNAVKLELLDRLRTWATLVLMDPRTEHWDLDELELDFYHMAHWHPAALSDLKRAHEAGIPTVNSYSGASATADRLTCYRTLRRGNVLVPEYQYARAPDVTLPPPTIVKPRYEFEPSGHEFSVHFADAYDFPEKRIVQRYVVPHRSYKLFGIGDEIRAVRLFGDGSVPVEQRITPSLARYVERVRVLFDLSLYELDLLVHKSIYVIDVNPAVNLDGVLGGAALYEELIRRKIDDE